jgi:hypothetical protein
MMSSGQPDSAALSDRRLHGSGFEGILRLIKDPANGAPKQGTVPSLPGKQSSRSLARRLFCACELR